MEEITLLLGYRIHLTKHLIAYNSDEPFRQPFRLAG